MAIFLNGDVKLLHPNDHGSYDFSDSKAIDLRASKITKSSVVVLYAPSDVKKLARANKITYVQALKYFEQVGIDDHSGSGIYIPKQKA